MPRPLIADVRELSDSDLDKRIAELRRELFDLRFQQATRQLEKPHRFKETRLRLAHLLTVRSQRNRTST
ncbi:50S ribosomal protein L29 [Synechococcus sp. RSCCF101]|uniref:50S ribosomal protein L29 n=1 Tax=Synechococcus sp. RSCCF101 TaxID=2511069 RepID=UPI001247E49F|nr:50S ribosomal protein L29 [Synechococcus sp. RSCCF101]QEY32178.1 50S ribosomal protein L29 [Synechococcus sp. RSCCF101]